MTGVYVGPTPGPWHPQHVDAEGGVPLVSAHGPDGYEHIAYVYDPKNAHLVAAAPIVLNALQELLAAVYTNPDHFNRCFAAAESAVRIAHEGVQ